MKEEEEGEEEMEGKQCWHSAGMKHSQVLLECLRCVSFIVLAAGW